MNKNILIIAIAFLFLACPALASVSVTLGSASASGNNVTFSCTAAVVDPSDTLASIDLFLDSTGSWGINKTNTSCNNKASDTVTFIVESMPNGNWNWNCRAHNKTEFLNFSDANGTVNVNYVVSQNNPPILKSNIPDITIYEKEIQELTLTQYFSDPENNSLTFTSNGPSNLVVTITGNTATVVGVTGWVGTQTLLFNANDGTLTTQSNPITVTVLEKLYRNATNTAPNLTSKEPAIATVTVKGSQLFSINASDKENSTLTVKWLLDGVEVDSATYSYNLSDISPGQHTLNATVSDGVSTTETSWAITYEAATELPSIPSIGETPETGPECGDLVCEGDETCNTCEDCKCPSGTLCTTDNKCKASNNILLYIIISAVIMGVITFVVIKAKGGSKPAGTVSSVRQSSPASMPPPMMPPPMQMQANEPPSPAQFEAPSPKETAHKEEWQPSMPPPSGTATQKPQQAESPIRSYIRQMRAKGHTDEEIRQKLRKIGWPDYQIAIEFLTTSKK